MASLLFAPLAWDLPEDKTTAASTSSTGTSAAESTKTSSWPASEPSAPAGRWRINSGDLEEMMRVASGLDSTSRSASAPLLEDNSSSTSPPLSREDLVEERGESVVGFPLSRGSSPLYRKQHQLHQQQQQHANNNNSSHHAAGCSDSYQVDHQLDTTAPSSPCTPSLHMRGTSGTLSAVSPTSSRSDEVAFQQQLSLEADTSRAAAAPASLSARPSGGVVAHGGANSGSPSGGRFGLKLLVSNSMAGTLIGKGGTRICEIKDEVSIRRPSPPQNKHAILPRQTDALLFFLKN